jgi:hypothetical protein
MGKYKDENGKTRVGVFLQEYAPDALDFVASLTGISALEKLGEAIEGATNLSPEQKARANELLELDIKQEMERTKRQENDMSSDSWLSKNIRPMALVYLTLSVSIIAVLDSSIEAFVLRDGYISLFTSLLLSVYGFYFVGREINKMILNRKK